MKNIKEKLLSYAKKKYETIPDAPFRTAPTYFVLRHSDTRKWYALFMNIPKSKLGLAGDEHIDILNIKCDPVLSGSLRMNLGYYPAYHMHRTNWLTILLDGTVPVEDICPLLDMSYEMTQTKRKKSDSFSQKKSWIIPANPKYYDIETAVNENTDHIFIWKQSTHIAVGDVIYMYIAAPVSAIRYKCKAIEVDIPCLHDDDNVRIRRVMRLQLLETYNKAPIGLKWMKHHGVSTVRGPRNMPGSLIREIEMMYHTK